MPDKTMNVDVYRVGQTVYLCPPMPRVFALRFPDPVKDWDMEVATWPALVIEKIGTLGCDHIEFVFNEGTELN